MTAKLSLALLATTGLVPAAALAQELPTGGEVRAGQATITQGSPGAMRITQGSNRAVINWQSFSVGEGGRVDISQPDARSALLNRVTGDATSTIAGQINANGRVFLVNPNGILITRTGSVNAAGFTASTLDIADKDFMAGSDELTVTATRLAAPVRYARGGFAGLLGGEEKGYVVAGVRELTANGGQALDLDGAGFLQVAMPKAGITVAGRISAGEIVLKADTAREAARGVVNVSGMLDASSVSAKGGTITLTGDVVNLAGATLDASGATGGGRIRAGGEYQGGEGLARARQALVDARTALRADATGSGDGGSVVVWSDDKTSFVGHVSAKGAGGGAGGDAEVSGKALLDFTGTADLTGSRFGTLLLDPYNVTISTGAQTTGSGFTATGNDSVVNVTTLQNALATANVTVSTGTGGTQDGTIFVDAPVNWSSGSQLTLNAAGRLIFNAGLNVDGGGQVALAYNTAITGDLTGGLTFAPGASITFADGRTGQALTINGVAYTLLRSMADVDGIDGIAASNAAINTQAGGNAGRYALAKNLNAGGTTYDIALFGARFFVSNVGTTNTPFTGTFAGLGHVIDGLTITTAALGSSSSRYTQGTGLISTIGAGGVVRDLGLTSVRINERFAEINVGALAATVTGGSVIQAYSSGSITGIGRNVGGLVGTSNGRIVLSYSAAAVESSNTVNIGGLVGNLTGGAAVLSSYATGSVAALTNTRTAQSGTNGVGGLIGYATGTSSNRVTVTNAYATGAVSSDQASGVLNAVGGLIGIALNTDITDVYATGSLRASQLTPGGLVGYSGGSTYTSAYWDVNSTGRANADGGSGSAGVTATGLTTAQLQSGTLPAGFDPAIWTAVQGFYPVLTPVYRTGTAVPTMPAMQVVSGTGLLSTGAGASGASIGLYYNGSLLSGNTVTTDSTGAYRALVPTNTLSGTFAIGQTITLSGANAVSGLSYADNITTGSDGNVSGLTVTSDTRTISTGAASSSALMTALGTTFGDAYAGIDSATGSAATTITARNAAGFALDVSEQRPAAYTLNAAGPLSVRANVFSAGLVTLASAGALTVDAPLMLVTEGGLTLTSGGVLSFNRSLDASFGQVTLNFATTDGATRGLTFAPGAKLSFADARPGQALTVNGSAYTLVRSIGEIAAGSRSGRFALVGDVTAPTTTYTNNPIDGTFTGTLEGLGHTITGLKINSTRPGFFSELGGTVRDLYLTDATISGTGTGGILATDANQAIVVRVGTSGSVAITGQGDAGGLVGAAFGATIIGSFSSATVSAPGSAGGLIGDSNESNVGQSYATGRVIGANAAGLVGRMDESSISQSYATGAVTGSSSAAGLVNVGSVGYVSQSYATGRVSGSAADQSGLANGAVVQSSYFDTQTTGQTNGGRGATGLTTAELQSGTLPAGFDAAVYGAAAGFYPYLKVFGAPSAMAPAMQVVTGTGFASPGTAANGASVGLYYNGTLLTGATVTTDSTGAYRALVPTNTLSGTFAIGQTITLSGASAVSGLSYADNITTGSDGNVSGLTVTSGTQLYSTGATSLSELNTALDTTFGSARGGIDTALNNTASTITGRDAGGFTIDQAVNRGGAYTLTAQGPLTIAAALTAADQVKLTSTGTVTIGNGGSVSSNASGDAILLAAATTFANNGGAGALNAANGRWLVYQGSGLAGTRGGLAGGSFYNDAYDFTAGTFATAPASGNRFVYAAQPTLTVTADTRSATYTGAAQTGSYSVSNLINGDTAADAVGGTATGLTTPSKDVGSYTLTPGGLTSSIGYAINYAAGTYTITPATLSYVANAASRSYGDANPAFGGTVSGFLGSDTQANSTTGTLAFASTADQRSNVGRYAINGSGLSATNYTFGQAAANATALTVGQRALTVAADAKSRTYGDANPALTFTSTGLVNGDTTSGALATTADQRSNVGTYAITQGTVTAGNNYALSYQGANLTVGQRALTVAADAKSRAYGDANPTLTFTSTGLVNGDATSGALATTADQRSNVGTYAITQGSVTAGSNYALSYQGANLTVGQRALTVAADAKSRTYGDANPALTYQVGGRGLVNGDQLSGALATTANERSNVGTYAITQGTVTAGGNYALTYQGANLTVGQRALTVAADAKSRTYGDANPALTFTSTGLVNGDTTSGSLATTADQRSNVGTYAITQGSVTAGNNYALSYQGANLTVGQRALTVAADAKSRTYGDANPALTFTSTGLVNGDTTSGALATTADQRSNVGTYAITQGTVTAGNNYALSYQGANLTVGQRALTVAADAKSRSYGDANPALTYQVGGRGLVNGDQLSGALTTTANERSNVGTYAIGQGSLAATPNYAVTYSGASLTVGQRALTVAADAKSRSYGDANPALTFTSTGLVNGDTTTGALVTTANERSNVGSYAITRGTVDAGSNYALTYQGANLTVGQRALTVAADAKSRTYGDANPALTFTSTGLVNGDTTSGALATTADQRSNVGSYAITRGSLQASGNYSVTYRGANLSVTPRPLTITADLVRRFAGEANPALTFQVGGRGLANGDIVTGSLFTAATSQSPAGSYPIGQGSLLASSNYTLTFLPGRLVVAPARVVTSAFTAGVQQRDSLVRVVTPGGDTATLDLLNYVDAVVLSEGVATQLSDCVENKPCRTIH